MISLDMDFESERRADIGLGVTVTFRAPDYATYRACEAAALRDLRTNIEEMPSDPDMIGALAEQSFLDMLVDRCATAWEGVTLPDGTPAPLDADHWRVFRSAMPRQADALLLAMRRPVLEVIAEGNASTASPNGDGEAVNGSATDAGSKPEQT